MTRIDIKVAGAAARLVKQDGILTDGMVGATVTFAFDGTWDGLSKTAVFRAGGVTRDQIMGSDTVRIPPEVLLEGKTLYVGVEGRNGDGSLVIPTVWVRAGTVYDGANASGDPSTDPTLPVWAQIVAMIGELGGLKTVDKSSLVAAINEVLSKSGGGSIDEGTIAQLVEEYLAEHPADPGAPGEPGDDGGYYTPTVTQDEAGAAIISWEASRSDMPAVQSREVELPAGPKGDPGSGGRSAYQYAVDGGYTGTEEEFARKLAEDVTSGGGGPEIWRSIHNAELAEEVSSIYVNFFETPCKKIRIQLETLAADANSSNASIAILTDIQGGKTFHWKSESLHTVPLTTARISLISAEVSKTDEGNTLEVESTLCSANGIGNLGSSYRKTTFNDAKDIYGEKLNSTITAISIFSGSGFGIGTKIKIWGV